MPRGELGGWVAIGITLSALAIPWFLWGSDAVVAGFPLWLWWHIAWMVIASVVFWLFARRAWGIGIEPESTPDDSRAEDGTRPSRSDAGGDRR
ncbi:DUF3311 domain-containing protein [Natrarchaeobius halalkaliphilus]|uniref:DUF3311 domain-containing protein n=1 Tax=Natrarchaeobius halalkaliphilus TaxID=1679091 RepID=A0A3N6M009_9EURY|nr:DUF3311 domain-containing protein [Natrarchaeobius halalkaliphilus]RQG88920.1 DUF3311 domain-containing protein [Natrarchaeobius halalkaliphilus]